TCTPRIGATCCSASRSPSASRWRSGRLGEENRHVLNDEPGGHQADGDRQQSPVFDQGLADFRKGCGRDGTRGTVQVEEDDQHTYRSREQTDGVEDPECGHATSPLPLVYLDSGVAQKLSP